MILAFPDILDSTLLASYKSCRHKFWLEYINHWKPKEPSVHLHAGAAFARGLEVARNCFYVGVAETPKKEQYLDAESGLYLHRLVWQKEQCEVGNPVLAEALGMGGLLAAYGDFQCPEDSAKSATRMAGALEFYFDHYPLGKDGANPITLANGRRGIEISFAEPLDLLHPETGNPLLYCGRLDMAAEYAGGVFGEDDKTTSSLGATWSKQWDLRSQFTGYCWGLGKQNIKLNGFLVRGVSILKTKYDTQQAVTYRAPWQIDEWLEGTHATVRDMLADWKAGYFRKVLDHACTDFGGCGFRQVCLSQDPSPYLNTYYQRKMWNPLTPGRDSAVMQQFTIEGQPYGETSRSPERVRGEAQDPISLVFFCYSCGRQFAQAGIPNRTFHAIRGVCSTCPPESYYWNWVPGSVWLDWDPEFNKALPLEVLRREFELHLKELENEQVNGSEGTAGGTVRDREDLLDRDGS